jgi:hypothetical protein
LYYFSGISSIDKWICKINKPLGFNNVIKYEKRKKRWKKLKKKSLLLCSGIAILAIVLLVTGCQRAPEKASNTFATTYYLNDKGRSFSISGNSDGMPGEQSEYVLKIHNNVENWLDEYYVLLVDSDSITQEIDHEHFNLPSGGGIQKPITVEYPKDFEGALGLCVIIPQRACLISTLSIGVKDAITTGWPDVSTYPVVSQ